MDHQKAISVDGSLSFLYDRFILALPCRSRPPSSTSTMIPRLSRLIRRPTFLNDRLAAIPSEISLQTSLEGLSGFVLALLIGGIALAGSAEAQDKRAGNTMYVRAGVSITDYSGDADGTLGTDNVTNVGDLLFDTRKFTAGDAVPYALSGELGYRVSPALDVGLGYSFGKYAFIHGRPFTMREGPPGTGGDLGTVRHTVRLLGRYTLKAEDWTVAPYFDGGVTATFGGHSPGVGPSAGAGLDVVLNDHTSLFLETRFHLIVDDTAVDGLGTGTPVDALTEGPTLGVRYNVGSTETPPRILALECPTDVRAVDSVSLIARVNAEETGRPLDTQWSFDDGRTASGQMVSHAFGRLGTYDVTFTARNDAGSARASCTVTVTARKTACRPY